MSYHKLYDGSSGMATKFEILYHLDENGNVRVWWMEQDGDKYRAVSGIRGGKLVTSEWKLAKAKNVGRANATTAEEQATSEIFSQYTKKRERKYHDSVEETSGGSKIIEPMLADKFKGWDTKWSSVFTQPKLDGMRCIVTRDGMFSRQGKPIVSVPHIYEALKVLFEEKPDLILDGELYNHDLKDNFDELISLCRKTKPEPEDLVKSAEMVQYHIYDVVSNEVFYERLQQAYVYCARTESDCIHHVESKRIGNAVDLDEDYGKLLAEGYEGQMIRLNTPYEQKRTKSLLKRKEFIDEEFEVIGILEGQGNWSGYAKSVMCRDNQGTVFNAGIKGNQDFTKELLTRSHVPKTVTVRYQNKTPDGSYRFPIAVMFYENERDV
jgi:DNA ligase-1